MPYCPKCDMEFVEGITVCSDCGGPLVASKEEADAIRQAEEEAARAAEREAFQAALEAARQEAAQAAGAAGEQSEGGDFDTEQGLLGSSRLRTRSRIPATPVYVKKSQQYEDLQSSASAFLLVGAVLLVISALLWAGVVRLPAVGFSRYLTQSVMTLLGLASLGVALSSRRSAKKVGSQVADEEEVTRQLVEWFLGNYSAEQLDAQISEENSGDLSPEERSLKRFDLIQDAIITNHDIADQSYVDLLAEEIYSKLFQD